MKSSIGALLVVWLLVGAALPASGQDESAPVAAPTAAGLTEARALSREARLLADELGQSAPCIKLIEAADDLAADLSRPDEDATATAMDEVDRALAAVERSVRLPSLPPRVKQRLLELRWKVRHLIGLLDGDDEDQTFVVGQVTEDQAGRALARLDELMLRSGTLRGLLERSDPELMYRNLLIVQMKSFLDPVVTIRQTLKTPPPWWTPDAYQAVVQIQRLVALTRNETRKLTPELMGSLKAVWESVEAVVQIVNEIEGGARNASTDAKIIYRPRPGGR